MELAFSLEGTGVHHLDGYGLIVVVVMMVVRDGGAVDGTKAALTESARGRERGGGTTEDGVGEPVRRLGVGRDCTFTPDFAKAQGYNQ